MQTLHAKIEDIPLFTAFHGGLLLAAEALRSMLPRLLLIDDDPLLRRAMCRALEHSFVVTVAGSVGEALAVMEREPFDVALSDLHLDGLSGLDLYVRLAKTESPLASRLVIATGSDTNDPSLDRLRQNGVNVIKKPLDYEATIALLRSVALRS